jgi:uncharacterized protein YggE
MAAGASRTIDRVLRIETEPIGGGPIPFQRMAIGGREMAVASDAPPISTGQLEIRTRVTLTAAFK